MTTRCTVLVTGGAGYIGSHAALALIEAGHEVVVLDDLSSGHRDALAELPAALVEGDIGDAALLDRLLATWPIGAVLHFAAATVVPESVERPLKYYRNNTAGSLVLIERAAAHGVRAFVFSSTAAVYGNPERMPVAEDCPPAPISPYGRSKLMVEQILADAGAAHGLPHVILRYFNVAGADPDGRLGQRTEGATHLIKVACEVATGKRPALAVYGDDYPTPDGTCLRDFIHVSDLAAAHVRALDHLLAGGSSVTLNCGYGHGSSVREVLRAVERVSGRRVATVRAPRRPGDPVAVIAETSRIRAVLDWQPRLDDLERIVAHALAFEAARR
jgi:UDP-glucose 4-epimerase